MDSQLLDDIEYEYRRDDPRNPKIEKLSDTTTEAQTLNIQAPFEVLFYSLFSTHLFPPRIQLLSLGGFHQS